MDYNIRQATSDDINDIIPLWTELFLFHEPLDASFEMMPDAEEHYIPFIKSVIESQDEQKGIVYIAENPSSG